MIAMGPSISFVMESLDHNASIYWYTDWQDQLYRDQDYECLVKDEVKVV